MGPLFFPPWIHSWVDLRNPISMPAEGQCSCPFHRPLTVTMNTLLLPPTSLDRWASRPQSSGTFARACRKEIIITLNSPSYLFHPVPIHLFIGPNWTFRNAYLNMLQWILCVLRIKLVFQKRLPALALMSAQAITRTLLPCTVTFCAALPEEFSQELEAAQQCQKVKLQEQPQIARVRVWDQHPHFSAQLHCLEVYSTQPLGDWAPSPRGSNLLPQTLWAFFLSCLIFPTLHYCIYWELPYKINHLNQAIDPAN